MVIIQKYFVLRLDDRILITEEKEFDSVILSLRSKIVKFNDMGKLLDEHKYLFKNCDPIW